MYISQTTRDKTTTDVTSNYPPTQSQHFHRTPVQISVTWYLHKYHYQTCRWNCGRRSSSAMIWAWNGSWLNRTADFSMTTVSFTRSPHATTDNWCFTSDLHTTHNNCEGSTFSSMKCLCKQCNKNTELANARIVSKSCKWKHDLKVSWTCKISVAKMTS